MHTHTHMQMASDTEELSRCTSASLAQAISSSATIVGALVQLTLISPQLTLLVVAIAPPIAAFAALASRTDRRLRRRYNEASSAGTISAGEAFSKLPTIQAYAQEEHELRRYICIHAYHAYHAYDRTMPRGLQDARIAYTYM